MTDPLDLDALEAAEKAATPGPWMTTRYSGGVSFTGALRVHAGTDPEYGEPRAIPANDPDADLIVLLRNNAKALIAEVRRLRAIIAEEEKELG